MIRWSPGLPPDDLGAVVHGPAIISRSPGIVAGVRCVFAHATGLSLRVVVRAEGVQAEAAARRMHDHGRYDEGFVVTARVDDQSGPVLSGGGESSGGDDTFAADQGFWIEALPADGRLTLGIAWPEAGLAAGEVTLTLTGLDRLDSSVLPLL